MILLLSKITQIFALLALCIAGLLVTVTLAANQPPGKCGVKDEDFNISNKKTLICGNYIWDLPPKDLPVHLSNAFAQGKDLFQKNCYQCHSPGADVVVGPGLKGIFERRNVQWLIPWIRNSQKVINDGDPYANKLYKTFSQTPMPTFQLSNDEIKSILFYLGNRGKHKIMYLDSLPPTKNLND